MSAPRTSTSNRVPSLRMAHLDLGLPTRLIASMKSSTCCQDSRAIYSFVHSRRKLLVCVTYRLQQAAFASTMRPFKSGDDQAIGGIFEMLRYCCSARVWPYRTGSAGSPRPGYWRRSSRHRFAQRPSRGVTRSSTRSGPPLVADENRDDDERQDVDLPEQSLLRWRAFRRTGRGDLPAAQDIDPAPEASWR